MKGKAFNIQYTQNQKRARLSLKWLISISLILSCYFTPALAVTFTTPATIAAGNTAYEDQQIIVDGTTLIVEGIHAFTDLQLVNGAVLTHSAATLEKPDLTVSTMRVDGLSRVDMSGKGLGFSGTGRAGGSYGGRGGTYSTATSVATFGDYRQPADFGTGGNGTLGGGSLKLTVTEELVLNGQIVSKGSVGSSAAQGGGSGGSLWLDVASIRGTGTIDASGGNGYQSASYSYQGPGGGGGRVAIYYGDATGFDLTAQAISWGGLGFYDATWGGAGTVYLKQKAASGGELRIENPGYPFNSSAAAEIQGTLDKVIIDGAVVHVIPQVTNVAEVFDEIVLLQGAALSHAGAVDAVSENLKLQVRRMEVDATSKLDVSGKGLVFSGTGRAGGSYGGRGGTYSTATSVATFGDYRQPADFGTGGNGTLGGGSLKLTVTEELVLNGQIVSKGSVGSSAAQGGGSGGSLWLDVASIRGTGTIDASGGNGYQSASYSYQGPGGGGGRVAIYYGDATGFDLTVQAIAKGGLGFSNASWGGAGTIYLKQAAATIGELRVDNEGTSLTLAEAAEINDMQVDDRLVVRGMGSIASLTNSLPEVFDEIILLEGGVLTHPKAVSDQSSKLEVQVRRIDVDATSKLDVSGKGLVFSGTGRAGGSYGGRGGTYSTATSVATFGDYRQPADFGTGGNGTLGGGSLKLTVTEELVLNGQIVSKGSVGSSAAQGGGSGGSLWLDVASIRGTGTIDASGGNGYQSASYSYQGPGGGGGRVAIYYGDATGFDLTVQSIAKGGLGFSNASWGGAGTIYLKQAAATIGELRVDNEGTSLTLAEAAEINDMQVDDRLVVRGMGSIASLTNSLPEVFDEIILLEGGVLTHPKAVSDQSSKLEVQVRRIDVDATSKLDVSGKGLVFSGTGRAGGSYGGRGGTYSTATSVATFGDYRQPADFGTGGNGTLGGGSLKLTVTEELVLNGQIVSKGSVGSSAAQGGGSGGSLWLNVASIRGTGTIDASGGNGYQSASYSYQGPGGGGGRVAVYYGDATGFDLTVQSIAKGGLGFSNASWGGAGTIYLKQAVDQLGVLRVDNVGAPPGNTAITELSGVIDESILSFNTDIVIQSGSVINGAVDLSGNAITIIGSTFSGSVNLVGPQIDVNGSRFSGSVDLSGTSLDVAGSTFLGLVKIVNSQLSGDGAIFSGSLSLVGTEVDATGITFNLDSFNLKTGSNLTTAQAVSAASDKLVINARLMQVDATSKLDVSGKGLVFSGTGRAGGSYGGRGGTYSTATSVATFGDYRQPADFGTGGNGTLGGGSLKLTVTEELVLNGQIVSKGSVGSSAAQGGGSGGSLWLDVASIRGTGTIDASGGNGYQSASYSYQGPGGGGGRVAIYYGDATGFDLTVQSIAKGGLGFSNASWGGAGTIYLKQAAATIGELRVDNEGTSLTLAEAAEINDMQVDDRLVVRGMGSIASLTNSLPEVFDEIILLEGGVLTHPKAVSDQSSKLEVQVRRIDVDATSKLDVSGKGLVFSGTGRAGGSYGGRGGTYSTATSVATFGDYRQPADFGTGGNGTLGGGSLKLTVTEELVLNGQIVSKGSVGSSAAQGGGSGGSLWLNVASIRGTGTIDASGGNGYQSASYSYQGPGGGGGRVAVYYGDATGFDLTVQSIAKGGLGFSNASWGGAGTIYLKQAVDQLGVLRVDNSGAPVDNVETTELAGFQSEPVFLVNTYLSLVPGSSLSEVNGDGLSSIEITGALNTPSLTLNNVSLTAPPAVDIASPLLTITANKITIAADASINVTGKGILKTAEVTGSSAGSYGGSGAVSGGTTNALYGDEQQPVDFGTGGYATRGGGAIKIVTDELNLEGSILALGQSGVTNNAAGGSGGSILLNVARINGAGTIDASGGDGKTGIYAGVGGGGGRIAVYYDDSSGFDEATQIVNAGGIGPGSYADGQPGTVYFTAKNAPAYVLYATPEGFLSQDISQITLRFSTTISPTSFTDADVVLTGPSGEVITTTVTPFDPITYLIIPDSTLVADGIYNLSVGSDISTSQGKIGLDQDRDGIAGEPVDDVFVHSFTIDQSAPVSPTLTSHTTGSEINVLNSRSIILQGQREANTSVWINGIERVALGSNNWSVNMSLAEGSSTLSMLAKDATGNASPMVTVGFNIDSISPRTNGIMAPAHASYTNQIMAGIQLGFDETGSGLNFNASSLSVTRDGFTVSGNWTVGANMLSFIPALPFVDGIYYVSAQLVDAVGNTSPVYQRYFVLDRQPPVAPVVDALPATTNFANIDITGTKPSGTAIAINATSVIAASSDLTWTYPATLTPGTNNFNITARDQAGNDSSVVTVTIEYDDIAPGTVAITADGIGSGTTVSLSWDSYDEQLNGADISHYEVYQSDTAFTGSAQAVLVASNTSGLKNYQVTGLIRGASYYFAVVAVDISGNRLTTLSPLQVTTADQQAPEDITNLQITSGETQLDLNWAASADSAGDLAGYTVYVNSDTGIELPNTATSYTVTSLVSGSANTIRIVSRDTDGNESNGVTKTGVTLLNNPTLTSVAPFNSRVTLNWTALPSTQYVSHHAVYVSEASFTDVTAMTPVLSAPAGATSISVAGLTNATQYWFAVTAVNTSGGERKQVVAMSGTPVADTTGPVLGAIMYNGAAIADGATVTVSGNFSITATDPSGISRVEFSMDGTLLNLDAMGTDGYSSPWSIESSTDGAHTLSVQAYDTLDNVSTENLNITAALALPAAPVITSPAASYTTSKSRITISGTAPVGSQVSLRNNSTTVAGPFSVDSSGAFSSFVLLDEGDNSIDAIASNRTGSSVPGAAVIVTRDSRLPAAPGGLSATAEAQGVINIRWDRVSNDRVLGYDLYRSGTPFTDIQLATKVNGVDRILDNRYADLTPDDGSYYYRVVVISEVGVDEVSSEPSVQVSATSDSTGPQITSITFTPEGAYDLATDRYGVGYVAVSVTVNEPLLTDPFISVVPNAGFPISIGMTQGVDNLVYEGGFNINQNTPSGTASILFSARDAAGNPGTDSRSLEIDTTGPIVTQLTVVPSAPIKNDANAPASISFEIVLSEDFVTGAQTPISYQLSGLGRVTTQVDSFNKSADKTWQGDIILPADAGLTEAENLTFIFSAQDDLGNVSTKITAPNSFQVYQGELPPLDTPTGLTAKLTGATVQLDWQPVDNAAVYELYRQAPGEALLTLLQRPVGNTYQDTLSIDGAYSYTVSSVRQANNQEKVSSQSNTVSVTLDTQAPAAPEGLTVQMIGADAQATWTAPVGTETLTYNLYRAATTSFQIETATLVKSGIQVTGFIDPSPSSSERYYQVVAVDISGNLSTPSSSAYLLFNVLPAANMVIEKMDDLPPVISWSHDGFNLAGFNLSLADGTARLPLHQGLLVTSTFTDSGYADDYREYVVVAQDNDTQTSAERSIRLVPVEVTLPQDAVIQRGVFNVLEFSVTNKAEVPVTGVKLKVTVQGETYQSSVFSLAPGELKPIKIPVAGHASLPDLATLQTIIEMNQSVGETVRLQRNSSIPVTNGLGLVLDIVPEEMIRGGQGKMHFTLQNPGEIETQVVVAQSSGASPSNEVRIKLIDSDDNIYAVSSILLGPDDVDILPGGQVVATIAPGVTYMSGQVTFDVPANSPEAVNLTMEIDALHYHLGQSDAVSINGLDASRNVTLVDTPYSGTVDSITPSVSRGGEDIVIQGQALVESSMTPISLVPLNVVITVNGFERSFEVITDASGQYSMAFTPLVGESGNYTVSVVHPDLKIRPVHGEFAIGRLFINPDIINLRTSRNIDQPLSIQASVKGAAVTATNLHVEYVAADQLAGTLLPGISITQSKSVDLSATQTSANLELTIHADNLAPDSGSLVLRVLSDETGTTPVDFITVNFQFMEATASLYLGSGFLETGVVQGESINETVTIENIGIADSEEVLITLLGVNGAPAPEWITLLSKEQQAPITIGETRAIELSVSPPISLVDGYYEFQMLIVNGNSTQALPIGVTVSAAGQGAVLFHISDIYTGWDADPNDGIDPQLGVDDVTISLVHERTPNTNSYELVTGVDGTVLSSQIGTGWYRYRISKENHEELSGRVQIKSGLTVSEDVFLDFVLVSVEWFVREVTIEDRYEIVMQSTFETLVPAAVVVADPPSVTLPEMEPGDVYYGEFTLTNYGLIKADNLNVLSPPEGASFSYELLEGLPDTLGPKEQIRVPYRVIMHDIVQADVVAGAGVGGCNVGGGNFEAKSNYQCANGDVTDNSTSHEVFPNVPRANCASLLSWRESYNALLTSRNSFKKTDSNPKTTHKTLSPSPGSGSTNRIFNPPDPLPDPDPDPKGNGGSNCTPGSGGGCDGPKE